MNKDKIFKNKWPYFKFNEIKLLDKWERLRKTSNVLKLSKSAKQRLEWIIYYYTKSDKNVSLTCRYYGISRKTFYKWFNQFNETSLRTLDDKSKAPHNTRKKEYTNIQYVRVIELRKQYIKYGKVKIFRKYIKKYPLDKTISEWNVQCIIELSGIYYKPAKKDRIQAKRARAQNKKRITELKIKPKSGYLLCLDTVVKYWNGQKRYIITAIDKFNKLAFARMYVNHSSLSAKDFLLRLNYALNGKIENIQTDNGSEFMMHFDKACSSLNFNRYFSRNRTPKDNAVCERFNRTLKEEFISMGNMTSDIDVFNRKLTEWLVEYNFERPHQSLDYLAPAEFVQKYSKVLPMWSSSTHT